MEGGGTTAAMPSRFTFADMKFQVYQFITLLLYLNPIAKVEAEEMLLQRLALATSRIERSVHLAR